jgi:cytochrome c biogenesis protein CcmG, thiol:disulfide interchange protein DsbE
MKRLITVFAIVALLGGLFYFGLTRTDKNRDIPAATLNQPVDDFELPVHTRYQGEYGPVFKLSDYKDKPMVINFWASWCPPCREEMPVLERGWQKYGDKILFLGIQTQDRGKREEGEALINEFNLTFPSLIDDDSRVSVEYALFGVPETFFVRADGTLLYKFAGGVDEELLEQKIGELLQ